MPSLDQPSLTLDEIDDLLYFTRVNEVDDLQQTISELSLKYTCSPKDVILAAVDPESGNTVFHYCSANGFPDLLTSLLSHVGSQFSTGEQSNDALAKPMVNTANKQGNTPLHWASINGHLNTVKILLDSGADMSMRNFAGHLPVFEAEQAGKGEVVEYLLEKGGIDLNPEDLSEVPRSDPNAPNEGLQANGGGNVEMDESEPSG